MSKPELTFSFRVNDLNSRHTRLTVFNRGANAGTLTILTEDSEEFMTRLMGGKWLRGGSAQVEYEAGDGSAGD